MKKPKILLASLGSIGQRHMRNCTELLPEAELCVLRQTSGAIVDLPELVVQVVHTLKEAVEWDPEAVIISSPASRHREVADPFLDAGKNIFIEKPLESNFDKLTGFVERAEESTGFVMTGYVLRFLPLLSFIKSELERGVIGTVRTAFIQTGQYLPDWRPNADYRDGVSAQKKLGGGVLLELSHELDYASFLFGTPDSLMCSSGKLSHLDIDVEDSAHILFEYQDKRVAIQIDFLQLVPKMGLQIVGSKGTIEADLIKEKATVYSPAHPDGQAMKDVRSRNPNEVYLRQLDFFFAKSFADYQPRFKDSHTNENWASVRQAAKIIEIVDAAKHSNSHGVRVQL